MDKTWTDKSSLLGYVCGVSPEHVQEAVVKGATINASFGEHVDKA